jgi:hypothetical protein
MKSVAEHCIAVSKIPLPDADKEFLVLHDAIKRRILPPCRTLFASAMATPLPRST